LRPGVQAHTLGVLDDTQPARDALTSIKQAASLFALPSWALCLPCLSTGRALSRR